MKEIKEIKVLSSGVIRVKELVYELDENETQVLRNPPFNIVVIPTGNYDLLNQYTEEDFNKFGLNKSDFWEDEQIQSFENYKNSI